MSSIYCTVKVRQLTVRHVNPGPHYCHSSVLLFLINSFVDSFLPLFIILSCETGILTPYPLSSTNTDKTQSTHRPDNILLKFSLKALNMCCQFLQRSNKYCSVNPLRCKISTHCRLAFSVVFCSAMIAPQCCEMRLKMRMDVAIIHAYCITVNG